VGEAKGENWLQDAAGKTPSGRLLSPEDIAFAALFLASANLITGAVLDYVQRPVCAPRKL
jgi:NAD(P)-dependent dehydrogenase (short-subunit alcohol dehydrogenase family)